MLRSILLITLMLFSFGLTAQVRPDFFPEETTPTNTNFEVYSQKNGVNRRASLANLRKYFGAQIAVSSAPTPTGNPEAARNKVIVVLPDSATYFVDWNGNSTLLGAGTGAGGGELSNAYISSDTLYLVTPDSTYTLLIPAGADDWGTQVVEKDSTLRGDGTLSDLLRVNRDTFPTRAELDDALDALQDSIDLRPAGSGTPGKIVKWGTSSSLADSGVEDNGAGLITITGTRALRLPVGTTAQRSGTPVAGETRVNSTNSNTMEWYTGTAWEVPVRSATGLGTNRYLGYYNASNLFSESANMQFDGTRLLLGSVGSNSTNGLGALTLYQAADAAGNGIQFKPASNLSDVNSSGIYRLGQGLVFHFNLSSSVITGSRMAINSTAINSSSAMWVNNVTPGNSPGQQLFFSGTEARATAPSSGAGDGTYRGVIRINTTWNLTASANENVRGIDYNPTVTSIIGEHYGLTIRSGKSGFGTGNPTEMLHVVGKIRADTLTGTGTQLGGWTAGNVATTVTVGDNMALAGGTLSVPTRYALVTLDSTQHTLPFLSASTAPDSVGNLQVTDIGGIFTISAGKKTVKYSGTAGYFLVNYATSFQGIEGMHQNHIWKNGTIIESSRTRTEVATTPLSVAGVTVVQLTAGDELRFGYTPDNHVGTNNIVTSFLTITITRI